jgi:CDP-4-dehydro-6-deoxyglucose reductase/ferredoxin-NAD(P)+ reductase (naphthalene dioxygenase ferredoxin-specific)
MPTITISQWGLPVQARKGTILDAALAAGVPFPHSCRAGDCGDCKSQLECGDVFSLDPPDPAVLSKDERDAGVVLACRCWPKTDVTVSWLADFDPAEAAPVRQVNARVVGLEDATYDTKRLLLEVDGAPLAFAAGQFARLCFGRLPARSYSMANHPDEPVLEFHIRRVPDGMASGYVADELRLGEIVRLEGPFGTATLKPNHEGPILAVAGGAGLAPILSIVRTALAKGFAHPIHLYFGVRHEQDVYCEGELRTLAAAHPNLRVEIALSREQRSGERRTGYVQDAIAADLPNLAGMKLYVAGPPRMVDAVTAFAKARGVGTSDIHADPFTPSALPEQEREFLPLHANGEQRVGSTARPTYPRVLALAIRRQLPMARVAALAFSLGAAAMWIITPSSEPVPVETASKIAFIGQMPQPLAAAIRPSPEIKAASLQLERHASIRPELAAANLRGCKPTPAGKVCRARLLD